MTYPILTNLTEGAIPSLFTYINLVTDSRATLLLLVMIWLILYLGLSVYSSADQAIFTSIYVTAILSLPLRYLGVIDSSIMMALVIGSFLMFAVKMWRREKLS